tara:strand:+ start:253 stop:540 length:288 start_codon:yes stop_codon:yes gene_type:complete
VTTYITNKVLIVIGLICVALFAADFLRHPHGNFPLENLPLFYCVIGFGAYTGLIFAAKGLRYLIERPENYYGSQAVDAEPIDEPEGVVHTEVRHD